MLVIFKKAPKTLVEDIMSLNKESNWINVYQIWAIRPVLFYIVIKLNDQPNLNSKTIFLT